MGLRGGTEVGGGGGGGMTKGQEKAELPFALLLAVLSFGCWRAAGGGVLINVVAE